MSKACLHVATEVLLSRSARRDHFREPILRLTDFMSMRDGKKGSFHSVTSGTCLKAQENSNSITV